ncbi:hypothetical protein MIND_00823000 [Mycena indigotica]|uniref:Uncharacterized protein n=1 Tax=Mycena indigotica TaxID=2126181 RepID=A0A8H6SH88_9AGAR|nr:uncharacterized protein MIND_00823000 [Mycena indigotica]KAF7298755.1 hypothetical protein MIND_00823000 [Mycena indigotica]
MDAFGLRKHALLCVQLQRYGDAVSSINQWSRIASRYSELTMADYELIDSVYTTAQDELLVQLKSLNNLHGAPPADTETRIEHELHTILQNGLDLVHHLLLFTVAPSAQSRFWTYNMLGRFHLRRGRLASGEERAHHKQRALEALIAAMWPVLKESELWVSPPHPAHVQLVADIDAAIELPRNLLQRPLSSRGHMSADTQWSTRTSTITAARRRMDDSRVRAVLCMRLQRFSDAVHLITPWSLSVAASKELSADDYALIQSAYTAAITLSLRQKSELKRLDATLAATPSARDMMTIVDYELHTLLRDGSSLVQQLLVSSVTPEAQCWAYSMLGRFHLLSGLLTNGGERTYHKEWALGAFIEALHFAKELWENPAFPAYAQLVADIEGALKL